MKVELPPKYYLDHFREMLLTIRSVHFHLLEEEHRRLLKTFDSLSEDAQCLFIRMANRKGMLFERSSFEFQVWDELRAVDFVRPAQASDEVLFLNWAKKIHLLTILEKSSISFKKSANKDKLLELYHLHRQNLQGIEDELDKLEILKAHPVLHYILFVMFGKVQDSLVLYTLRDLGVRKPVGKKNVQAKFSSIEEAKSVYFYSTLTDRPLHWPEPIGEEARELVCEWKFLFAEEDRKAESFESALKLYEESGTKAANERRARLLHELGRLEECKSLLQKLIDTPMDTEELFFAEEFLARKFEKKKLGRLTEVLRSARLVEIDESFFRQPEMGVVEHYQAQGHECHFAENYLWASLLGVVFHDQLIELNVSSEFEWLPADLKGKLKYNGLSSIDWDLLWERDYSESPLVKMNDGSKSMLQSLVKFAKASSLDHMLRFLAEDYWSRNTGFPDLFAVENGVVKFIEVKAQGDSLKSSQLAQIQQIEKAGFEVEVLNVVYKYNPEQVYVVVDIETTGLMNSYNRITEVAAVKMKDGKVIDRFQSLLNPRRPIPRDIQKLTGITNEMVARAPVFEDIAVQLDEFTQGAIFVAHNASFDYGFIQREFHRLDQRFVRPFICTKAGMKKHYPGLDSYGLKNLSSQFGISMVQHHRAMSDAEAAAGLLNLINTKRAQTSNA